MSHWPYLIILAVIALIIFGPKRLPELGEGLGKAIREFRKATSEMGESLKDGGHHVDTATGTTYTAPVEPAAPAAAPVSAVPPPASSAPPPAAAPVPPVAPDPAPATSVTPPPATAPAPEAPRS